MILETFLTNKLYTEYKENDNSRKQGFLEYCQTMYNLKENPGFLIFAIVFSLVSSIVAGILAWNCNAREPLIFRMITLFTAVLFSDIYILYYVIYRVIMKQKCYKN